MADLGFLEWSRVRDLFDATKSIHVMTCKNVKFAKQQDIYKPRRKKSFKISHSQACRMLNGVKSKLNHEDCCEEADLDALVRDFLENAVSETEKVDYDYGGVEDAKNFNNHIEKLEEMMAPSAREKYIFHMVKSAISSIDEEIIDNCTRKCKGICIRLEIVKGLKRLGVDANLYKSNWLQNEKLPAGEYHYIEVLHNGDEVFIVDTDFRSQFEIARPIALYQKILNIIPCVFVGKPERLNQILEIMSVAASFSLKKNGLHVPPWRTLEYMHAKWSSNKRSKVISSHDDTNLRRYGYYAGNHECKVHLHDLKMLQDTAKFHEEYIL